jgi:hypothetical protein
MTGPGQVHEQGGRRDRREDGSLTGSKAGLSSACSTLEVEYLYI